MTMMIVLHVYDQFHMTIMMMMMMMMIIDDVTGWSRRRLYADSGRVQRRPLHSWRLNDNEPQWDEVQHQVRLKR